MRICAPDHLSFFPHVCVILDLSINLLKRSRSHTTLKASSVGVPSEFRRNLFILGAQCQSITLFCRLETKFTLEVLDHPSWCGKTDEYLLRV